ncbi:uncharacterized protein MONOS_12232p2 [Monocercomonoides exilis]|uniref:uncharacterized protein n=1 Tax=Monocercomonoides exilis TaxID=2049356 RepID=UPI003559C21C|nr:hypothetical protein MONOS_12232p2 [Monocercomonoides exilis]
MICNLIVCCLTTFILISLQDGCFNQRDQSCNTQLTTSTKEINLKCLQNECARGVGFCIVNSLLYRGHGVVCSKTRLLNSTIEVGNMILKQKDKRCMFEMWNRSEMHALSCVVCTDEQGTTPPFEIGDSVLCLCNMTMLTGMACSLKSSLVHVSERCFGSICAGSVLLCHSSIFSVSVNCGSTVISHPSAALSIRNTFFSNISHSSKQQHFVPSAVPQLLSGKCELESVYCYGSEDPYMGCIANCATCPLKCSNSTFMKCTATETHRQTFENEAKEFNDTTFTVSSSTVMEGGAIFASGNASLLMKRCVFDKCILSCADSRAGAVRIEGTGIWKMENSSIKNCSAAKASGAFDHFSLHLEINKCNFTECKSKYLGVGEIRNVKTLLFCENELINNLATDFYCGGVNLYNSTIDIELTNNLFSSNKALTNAGAVLFDHTQTVKYTTTIISCFFYYNSAVQHGNDIFVSNAQRDKLKLVIVNSYSISNQKRIVYEWDISENISHLLPDPVGVLDVIVVTPNGIDWSGCGRSENDSLNCLTVGKGVERASEEHIEMEINEGVFVSKQIKIDGFEITGKGKGSGASEIIAKLEAEEKGLFMISSGVLSLSDLMFAHGKPDNSEKESCLFCISDAGGTLELHKCCLTGCKDSPDIVFQHPNIWAAEGTVTLHTCEVSGFMMDNVPLVSLGDIFKGINSTFCDVTRCNVCGSILSCSVAEAKTVELDNSTIKRCKCNDLNGKGGGLCVKVENGGVLKINSCTVSECSVDEQNGCGGGMFLELSCLSTSYSVKNNTFSGNKGKHGKDIYIVTAEPEKMLEPSAWTDTVFRDIGEDRMLVEDKTEGMELLTSLIHFVFRPPLEQTRLSVDGKGRKYERCGWIDVPCNEVKFGMDMMRDDQTALIIKDTAPLDGRVNRGGKELRIAGNNGVKGNVVVTRCGCVEQTTGDESTSLEMCSLVVTLPCESDHQAFITVSVGKCVANFVEFKCGEEEAFGNAQAPETEMVVVMFGGNSLEMDNVGIHDFCSTSLSGYGLITAEKGCVALRGISISNCVFADGCGIKGAGMDEMTLNESCNICSCKRADGDGGGMYFRVKENGKLEVENTTMKECAVDETIGKGGGIYIELEGEDCPKDFAISDVCVSGNKALMGRDVFIKCHELNRTISRTRIFGIKNEDGDETRNDIDIYGVDDILFSEGVNLAYFLEERHSLCIEVSAEGTDVLGCGDELLPCESFWRGYANIAHDAAEVKEIRIDRETIIQDRFDLSGMSVVSKAADSLCELVFKEIASPQMEGCDWVLLNREDVLFERVNFVIQPHYSIPVGRLIKSGDADNSSVSLIDCSLKSQSASAVGYTFVQIVGGKMKMDRCSISGVSFCVSPFEFSESSEAEMDGVWFKEITLSNGPLFAFAEDESLTSEKCKNDNNAPRFLQNKTKFEGISLASTDEGCLASTETERQIILEDCVFNEVRSSSSVAGGAIRVALTESGSVAMQGVQTLCHKCECETESMGRGGFVCLECRGESSEVRFVNLEFENNRAHVGVDMFISCKDLTEVVNSSSFEFASRIDVSIRVNSLMGSDRTRFEGYEDLFVFITGYFNETIYVDGERGANNIGCGKEIFPCLTFETGVEHIRGDGEKTVAIREKCEVRRETKLDYMLVRPLQMESNSAIYVSDSLPMDEGVVLAGNETTICRVNYSIPGALTNGQRALIGLAQPQSYVKIEKCAFSLQAESTLSFRIFEINEGDLWLCLCEISGIKATSALICFNEASEHTDERSMKMEECSIRNIENDNNEEACALVCCINNSGLIQILNSTFEGCHADSNSCGGGLRVMVPANGMVEVNSTNICTCSAQEGKGGGAYLESEMKEARILRFVVSNVTFGGNRARVGRDMFVRCWLTSQQINEIQFVLDLREPPYDRRNAIWGVGEGEAEEDIDLIPLIVVYRSELIFVSGAEGKGSDTKPCGNISAPCRSLNYGLSHLLDSSYSQLLIEKEADIVKDCAIRCGVLRSKEVSHPAIVHLRQEVSQLASQGCVMECSGDVKVENIAMSIHAAFSTLHESVLTEANGSLAISSSKFTAGSREEYLRQSLITVQSGLFQIQNSEVVGINSEKPLFAFEGGCECCLSSMNMSNLNSAKGIIHIIPGANITLKEARIGNVTLAESSLISVDEEGKQRRGSANEHGSVLLAYSVIGDIEQKSNGASCITSCAEGQDFRIANCSLRNHSCATNVGQIMSVSSSKIVYVENSLFEGKKENGREVLEKGSTDVICRWNGSVVELKDCTATLKATTITNSSEGGLSVSGGSVDVEKSEFYDNSPGMEKYPSYQRNIVCTNSAIMRIKGVKTGENNPQLLSSLWILNEGCEITGAGEERGSTFFVPTLQAVTTEEMEYNTLMRFQGSLLLPCNLSFCVVLSDGEAKQITHFLFDEAGFESEEAIVGATPNSIISDASPEIEVSVQIQFGNEESSSFTKAIVVRNKTQMTNNNESPITKGEKGRESSWALIVIVLFVILFLIVLIVSIIFIVRWRKQKRRTEELEEIVNDTVKKDPKLIEMVTMEMSPEAQWRRAEKEAETKNDERIKKRVYEKSLGHSESSEHLLSESGSTEYILGNDSDKIPQWMLEKVEEEEIRKRSPSPSISSTSTTDTSDTESTFVRGEDLCPTTSSMSNLVDAMACSCPYEKLIVDLRDSLFMLLHGRNEKKEMAIGTLQEREMTGAQILFWVANLALHSFEDGEEGLSSLANLSPHIVLFSEHMVICIVMHSDFSSDDDSDSSSISSTTVVTSASDDDESDSLPSSAFEDEDDFKKECLRWKAPELLMNKKMGATKESVAFSIGMMLWECLTLQIPFGEYEAEVAGQKIMNGERPNMENTHAESMLMDVAKEQHR